MKQPTIRIQSFHRFSSLVKNNKRPKAYYFRLRAENGEIVASSEAYTRKASRDKTVKLLARARMEVVS